MRYEALEPFMVRTSKSELAIETGKIITLPKDVALTLINDRKIKPIGKVAHRLYTDILQAYLWIVADENDIQALRTTQNVKEAIYTADEVRKLKDIDKEVLKAVHRVKEIFPKSSIQEVVNRVN